MGRYADEERATPVVHPAVAAPGSIDRREYERRTAAAARDPEGYWREEARAPDWIIPFTTVKDSSFDEADFRIRWFADGPA